MESTVGENWGTANDPTAHASETQATQALHTRPPTSLGILGRVPLEIRSQIYDYLFSPNCFLMTTDPEACHGRPDDLNMLMTSRAVRCEALDELASKTFTLGCYVPHERSILVENEKVDIPNAILRKAIKHMRSIQVTLDASYLCGYVYRDGYWWKTKVPSSVFDWPSIAQSNSAPATDLMLALPSILAGAADNPHGGSATIVLRGSYKEFRYPVTKQGHQTFKDLVAVFKKFGTLKLRAEAAVDVRYGSYESFRYERLSEKRQAKVARAFTQYINVLIKKAKDVVGPSQWIEDKAEDSDGLKSGTAEFHPLAHLAAAPLPNPKTRRNNRRKKLKKERNAAM